MAQRIECYVDTSALIAFLDRSDTYHALFKRLFSDPPRLATSALVIAEGHGWFLRRYDQIRALQFLRFIDELAVLTIQAFDAGALSKSAGIAKKFADQHLTLADAHGLVLMQERRIASCWSTDRHLGLTGIPLIGCASRINYIGIRPNISTEGVEGSKSVALEHREGAPHLETPTR